LFRGRSKFPEKRNDLYICDRLQNDKYLGRTGEEEQVGFEDGTLGRYLASFITEIGDWQPR